jgi:hypothetical protein
MVMNENSETNIYYSSYSTHRLNTFQHKCINARDERLIFSTLEVEDCMTDCFLQELNRTYGCVDINNFNLQLNINKHLVSIGYRICPQLIRNYETIENAITKKCKEKCWPECNQLYFQTKSDANYMIKKMNLFPLNKPHVRYTETMRTDINQLIYTLGGIIGLWFSVTPLDLTDLFLYLLRFLKLSINLLHKISMYFSIYYQ